MKRKKMKGLLVLVVGWLILWVVILGLPETGFSQSRLTKVKFQLEWIPHCIDAHYALGSELGFYAEEGLEVEFVPGGGSVIVPTVVGTNKATFGVIDASVLLLAREKNIPVKAVASCLQAKPAIFFLKNSGIKSPKDLEGKSILVNLKIFSNFMLTVFLNKVGLSRDRVRPIDVGGPAGISVQMLLSGHGDAVVLPLFRGAYQGKLLKDRDDIGYFLFKDYGVDALNRVIIVNEQTIQKNPELVRRFVRASVRAFERALADPKAAVKALKKHFPEINEEYELASLIAALPFAKGSEAQTKGLGYMSPGDWDKTYKILIDTGLLTLGKINVKDAFTNEFTR